MPRSRSTRRICSTVADGYDAGPNVMEVLTLPGSKITAPKDLADKVIGTGSNQEIPTQNGKHQSQPYSMDTVAAWSVLSQRQRACQDRSPGIPCRPAG